MGIKDVTTYPAGWNGNDREYSSTHESWCSLDLHVIILNKLYNPDMGETTQRLTNMTCLRDILCLHDIQVTMAGDLTGPERYPRPAVATT